MDKKPCHRPSEYRWRFGSHRHKIICTTGLRAPPVFHCNDDPPQSKQTNSPRKIFHLIPECTTTRVRLSAAAGRLHLSCKKKKAETFSCNTSTCQKPLTAGTAQAERMEYLGHKPSTKRQAEPSRAEGLTGRLAFLYLISSCIR